MKKKKIESFEIKNRRLFDKNLLTRTYNWTFAGRVKIDLPHFTRIFKINSIL
jgi:hypothetical protein